MLFIIFCQWRTARSGVLPIAAVSSNQLHFKHNINYKFFHSAFQHISQSSHLLESALCKDTLSVPRAVCYHSLCLLASALAQVAVIRCFTVAYSSIECFPYCSSLQVNPHHMTRLRGVPWRVTVFARRSFLSCFLQCAPVHFIYLFLSGNVKL